MVNFADRKGITPVVAVALLLVVAVSAAVVFQTWYGSYYSRLFSKVETTSNYAVGNSLKIETLVGNNLYVNNRIADNLTVTSLKIGGKICNLSNLSLGINKINVSNCTSNLTSSISEAVLIAGGQIVSKEVYVSGVTSTSSSCTLDGKTVTSGNSGTFFLYNKPYDNIDGCSAISQIRTCNDGVLNGSNNYNFSFCNNSKAPSLGGEWILVFGNPTLGTNDFYVMKYEVKFKNLAGKVQDSTYKTWNWQGSTGDMSIISSPNYRPIANISQTEARTACSSFGSGYHLITDAEWITIARLAERNPSNWANGIIGSNVSSGGGMYRGNVNLNDNISCGNGSVLDGNSVGTNCLVGSRNKRTLNISGNMIWDFSGNVWERDNDTISANTGGNLGKSGWNWYEWSSISNPLNYGPTNHSFNSVNGVGIVYTGGESGSTLYGFLRGGHWYFGAKMLDTSAGVFALGLYDTPSDQYSDVGFRCSYSK